MDCPSCGRSIRVPQIDGTIEPVPEPSILIDDSKLAEAFSALSNLNEPVKIKDRVAELNPVSRSDSAVLPPPPIATPVALPPIPSTNPVKVEASQEVVSNKKTRSAEEEISELAESLSISEPDNEAQPKVEPNVSKKVIGKKSLPTLFWGTLIFIASMISFLVGTYYGSSLNKRVVAKDGISDLKKKELASEQSITQPASNWPSAITGRITYRSETGESRPDRGARVIVFPSSRNGSARFSAVGLRPGDDDVDFTMTKTGLQLAGANVTRVDDEGKFEIKLPAAGSYQILVVSRFVSQNLNEQSDSKMDKTLNEFFLKPAEVIGKLATVFGPVSFNGEQPIKWDHAFEAK